MKVYVLLDGDGEVWNVFASLDAADECMEKHYHTHSEWLKLYEQDVID